MKQVLLFLTIMGLSGSSFSDSTFTSTTMQYSIYLLDNWVINDAVDSQHSFYDTSGTYRALLFVSRSAINESDYATAEDWTRAHYLAYNLFAQNSYDPWGVLLYSDSSAGRVIDNLWAPVSYAHFMSTDTTLGSWREYVRYVATDGYGYEMSFWSDTADMNANIGVYAAIFNQIEFLASSSSRLAPFTNTGRYAPGIDRTEKLRVVDPLGRSIRMESIQKIGAKGVYLNNRGKRILNIRD